MPPHLYNNTGKEKYLIKNILWHKTQFNDVYSRNNLDKIKDGEYVTSLDECKSIGTHCFAISY